MNYQSSQQQQYQRQSTKQEDEDILLYTSALQSTDAVASGIGTPRKEVEGAIHYVAVEPCNGATDTSEDDIVGDKLIDLVHIEAVVGCCPQSLETTLHGIGHGLLFTFIYVGSQQNGYYGHSDAGTCHCPIEVDVVSRAVGTGEVPEGDESRYAGHHGQEHQREAHGKWTLVGSMVLSDV